MNSTFKLGIAVAVPLAVGGLSGFVTARSVATWYPTLIKPFFNPPAWVFGPTWTLLYIMMGVAAFLVWRQGFSTKDVRLALTLFAAQLALNGLWSILFFGLQSPGVAFAEIMLLWLSIVATVWIFRRVVPAAALLMLPYLAWVSFAAVLNGSIWMLN
ncbi:MAG: TspO/MBR family protein [Thermoanaerobaculia bacterium]|jgi:tryptophan-rich sensory protein